MVGKIIGLVSCLMCAFPFLIISVYNKDSREPINFWSGDTTLKSKVKNVVEYNKIQDVTERAPTKTLVFSGFPAIFITSYNSY